MHSQNSDNSNRNTLLAVGNIGNRQLHVILDSLLLLKNTGLRITLHYIGKINEPVTDILKTSETYKQLDGQLFFADHQSFTVSQQFSSYFAILFLNDENNDSGKSYILYLNSLMASGLPLICADNTVNKDIIEKNKSGICIDTYNAEEMADAISYLNRAIYQAGKMGEAGRNAVTIQHATPGDESKIFQMQKGAIS